MAAAVLVGLAMLPGAVLAGAVEEEHYYEDNLLKCDLEQQQKQDHPDRVTSLPGWEDQPLPSAWYSGYLNYELQGQQVHTHYVLIEAEQEETDTGTGTGTETTDGTTTGGGDTSIEKPLIYWSNGGPGASSLFGVLTELGPLLLSDDSLSTEEYQRTGIPSLQYNRYSWTKLGSILMIDQPAPVGFSYCNNDTTSHSCGGIAWTDELTSQNAHLALQAFYKKHPCQASSSSFSSSNKELYLTGESYGGIYIPTLARRILQDPDTTINLAGFAVGDGCLGTHTSMCGGLGNINEGFVDYWHVLFMAGHHQIPLHDFRTVMNACHHANDSQLFLTGVRPKDDAICKAALAKIRLELGGFYEYSLYDECTYRNGLMTSMSKLPNSAIMPNLHAAVNDYPCGGGAVMEEYLKLNVVKTALHVTSEFFEVDNAEGDFDYTPTEPDLTGFYQDVMHDNIINANNKTIKVLIYNGDTDPAITSFATQNWTSHLGLTETQHWRPWTVDGCQRMGGYVTRYKGGLDFVTIRGAGHMVPTYKPAASFAFMKAWLDETDYPTFDANCTQPSLSSSASVVVVAMDDAFDGALAGGKEEETILTSANKLRG